MATLDMRWILALALATSAAQAETPMTSAEFDAYVTGKILTFGTEGDPNYGVEQYLPGKRVRWSTFNGDCIEGRWYEAAPNICFAYENTEEHHCWTIFETPNGIKATNTNSGQVIFEGKEDPSALICGDLFS